MWVSLYMLFTVLELAYNNLKESICLLPADLFLDSSNSLVWLKRNGEKSALESKTVRK